MNNKLLWIPVMVLMLISFSFAAAPTVGDLILSNSYTTDRNYFAFPLDINAVATGADLNADNLCYYVLTTGGAASPASWDGDTNNCYVKGLTVAGGDDYNFAMIVQSSTLDANGTSPVTYTWRDNNAPYITYTKTGNNFGTTYNFTCTDSATSTGDGSGCASIVYSTNGGDTNITVNGSTASVRLDAVGDYTITYYSVDNLGNTRYNAALTTERIEAYSSGVCNLANLIVLVLIGATIVLILIAGFSLFNGGEMSGTIVALVATAIFMVIMSIIIATFTGSICFVG